MKPKFRVNDKVFLKNQNRCEGIITDVAKAFDFTFVYWGKFKGKKYRLRGIFKHYGEKDLELMCNEERNCKVCKYKLKCITEGV